MIAVIADDLTGAAELASAAADLGLTAEVHTQFDATGTAQVIAVDTDTRTMAAPEAARVVANIARDILRVNPAWIYKKTDSVLRGNVRAEIESILTAAGLARALFMPANPSKGRVIRDDIYYVSGQQLSETNFAVDPHHPRTTSNVRHLLDETSDAQLRRDIALPDVASSLEMKLLAADLDQQTLAAGGVEFFRAVLELRLELCATVPVQPNHEAPILFVCGSPQACRDGRLTQFQNVGIPVLLMPTDGVIESWADEIMSTLGRHRCAAVAIRDATGRHLPAADLAVRLAEAAADVILRGAISTVCMEGGATAAAVLSQLGETRLTALPTRSLPGVAALRSVAKPANIFLMKPGSYPWPETVFEIVPKQA